MKDKFGVFLVILIVSLILVIFWINRDQNVIRKPRIVQADLINGRYLRKHKIAYIIYPDGYIGDVDNYRFGRTGTASVVIYKEVIVINREWVKSLFLKK